VIAPVRLPRVRAPVGPERDAVGVAGTNGSRNASDANAVFAVQSMSRSSRAQKKCWWWLVTNPSPSGSEYGERSSEIQPAEWTMPVSFPSNWIVPSWNRYQKNPYS